MTEKFIDYYDSMSSPWTYLGHQRFEKLAHRFGLTIKHKPLDLLKVWSVSGGLPLKQRAQQRQAYRHVELKRWSELLQVPCNLEPAFHPVADRRACYMVIAAMQQGFDWSKLAYALLRAVWVEDRNIADHATLAAIADENGVDGKALLAATEHAAVQAEYQSNTEEAIRIGVFGAPTYVFTMASYFGDRTACKCWSGGYGKSSARRKTCSGRRTDMRGLLVVVAFAATLHGAAGATAQTYPSRPITVVVPFTAGGPTDALMRVLGERMRLSLEQPLVVENVTGAAGSIGVGRVARAAPDGYTLSVGHWSTHVINGAIYPLPFDLLKDLEPIALLTSYPMLLVSKNAVPAKDLRELIAWLRANQDKVSVGSIGVGSAAHIAGVHFENLTGLKLQYVPYRGAAPALQDLMGGQIDILFDHLAHSLPHVRQGKIRAYAVTAAARSPSAPDIPTVDEAGVPKLYVSIWYGLWAPKGTPNDVVAKLNAAVMDALADQDVRQRLADLGQIIPPREQQTPGALAAHHKAEIEKWWPIVRAANIKVE